jgi:hypothetical protein
LKLSAVFPSENVFLSQKNGQHRSIQQVKARGSSIAKKIERGVDVFADLEDSSSVGQYNEGSWSEEENRRLLVGIRKYGKCSWLQIEQVVKTR